MFLQFLVALSVIEKICGWGTDGGWSPTGPPSGGGGGAGWFPPSMNPDGDGGGMATPGWDDGGSGGGWFPTMNPGWGGGVSSTATAPIEDPSCEENGGTCFPDDTGTNCDGERGQYPCAEENFVCCLPNVLPSTCGDQALSRRLRRQSVRGISRIVGGAETKAHSWPWQVSLQLNDNNFHFCGGTLISDQWVVTAAHCLVGDSTVARVVLGEHDRSTENGREITSSATVFSHPNYENSAPYPNDIALLKLKTPVVLNDNIHPACLPENGTIFDTATDDCWITGWGDTKDTGDESKLNELQISIVDNESCASKWGENYILKTNICVGDGLSGACNGDSGGPLSCRRQGEQAWELAGVTSWGASGCQSEGLPNVYTRVSQYRQWILATMRKNL